MGAFTVRITGNGGYLVGETESFGAGCIDAWQIVVASARLEMPGALPPASHLAAARPGGCKMSGVSRARLWHMPAVV